MSRIMIVTAFVVLAPLAYAQSTTGTMGGMSAPGTMGGMSNPGRSTAPSGTMTGQTDPGNCGTPDEPKKCPPMPRRALQTYPANRQ
ncbi:MAG: hypothetical protein WB902_09395 [Acetobacteraceae bacterium]|jgi:hypothetical protein